MIQTRYIALIFTCIASLYFSTGVAAEETAVVADTVTKSSRVEFDACYRAVKRVCFKSEESPINGRMTKMLRGTCETSANLGKTKEGYPVFATFDVIYTDAEGFGKYGPPVFSKRTILTDSVLTAFRNLTYEKARADKPVVDGKIDLRVGSTFSSVHYVSTCIIKSAALAILDIYGNADEKGAVAVAGGGGTNKGSTPGNSSRVANSTLGSNTGSSTDRMDCEAVFRRVAEVEARQYSNPKYVGWTRDAIERLGEEILSPSFSGWLPNAPKRGPFEQMFSDPAMLRLYAKEAIELEHDPRHRLHGEFKSCLALRRAEALSGRPASAGSKKESGSNNLAAEQVASCTNEIKKKQRESRFFSAEWKGDSRENAARLARYQKELFEGRCSGHPEAQAYIAGANKMLSYGGNPSGSPSKLSAAEIRSCDDQLEQLRKQIRAGSESEQTKRRALGMAQESLFSLACREHPSAQARLDEARDLKGGGGKASNSESLEHNPLHDASNCIQFSGPDQMKARGLRGVLPSRIDNTCSFPIEVRWCVEGGNGRRGDCNPGYSNSATLAPPGGRGTSSYGVDAVNQNVRMAACKKGERWGFQHLKVDPRKPFDYACK